LISQSRPAGKLAYSAVAGAHIRSVVHTEAQKGDTQMIGHSTFSLILILSLLSASLPGPVRAHTLPDEEPVSAETTLPENLEGVPGATTDWWSTVQEDIRQSEYHVTWQERTNLEGAEAAYQAPNRAHNLRTTFTPQSIRVVPRTPPLSPPRERGGSPARAGGGWEWGLALSGYGYEGDVRPVTAATLRADANRIAYERDALTEWYVNDARGLEQGFTLHAAPQSTVPDPQSEIVLELALTGDLTPNLTDDGTAIEFTTPGGVRVLRYGELSVYDATGRALPAEMQLVTDHTIHITVDDAGARYPITVDPLATSPDWTAESDQEDAGFGSSVGTAGDVNGDGYSDVIVGAHGYDNGQDNEGRAFVYHGSAGGLLSATPNWTAESDQAQACFGVSVGTAGDVDGDGYSDVIVGANAYDNGQENEGRAFVYHGSATGLSTTPNWTAESDQEDAQFGWSVGTAGDVDGDGYSDVIVGANAYDNDQQNEGRAFVYHGSAAGLSTTPNWTAESDQADAWFGTSVGTAGDVNGDGYADVIVGADGYDNGQDEEGRAFVYHGSASGLSTTPDWTAEGDQEDAYFGTSVGTAGDVNGDGYADVIVGAYRYTNGEAIEGRAFVYHGSASGLSTTPDWTAESDQVQAYFGKSVGTAGDVNGDGYSDVIVGATWYTNGEASEGRAFVYHGSASGLSTTPDWTAEGDQVQAYFGKSVGTAGDVNGDGYSDVIVGANAYDNGQENEGRAFVYHGSAGGLSTTPDWTAESDQANSRFGTSVGTAGDVNGDGYADVIVGARFYDISGANEGRAFVYHGSAGGLSTTPTWTADGDQEGAYFGTSVGTAGDVNGDGYADVIVGAANYTDGEASEGRAFVYHGSASGLSTAPAWTAEGDQAQAYFGTSVGTAGDVNGDGYADVIVGANAYDNSEEDEGRAFVYHGSAAGLSATPDWTAESDQAGAHFGRSVGTAGDVDGDGYSDVIVGARTYDNDQTNEGRVTVYHGSVSGLSTVADWTAEGDQDYAYFGHSVGTAGDVDGDGYADVIVGAHLYDNGQDNEGRAFVYHGSASGLSTTPDWTAESNQAGAFFGASVGTAGDVNGDGYADVIVGAHYYDGGETDEGRATVYHGSAAGLSTGPDWTAESDQENAHFGWSVGTAGDVNGDGYADAIVGAIYYDGGHTDEGRAFLYYGNQGDGMHMLPRQVRSDGADPPGPSAPIAHLGLSDSCTAFRLSLIGRSPAGRGDARLHWQVAPLGTPFTATGVISGTSGWTDVLTTGVEITQTVSGLTPDTVYHWRVRLLYRPGNALGLPAGRWIHIPWNGWNETDLRTGPNQPPVAHAGSDQSVSTLAPVTLDGSGSSDPDDCLPLTCGWMQTGGPVVALSNPTAISPTFTAPSDPAVLTFTLAVTDSLGLPDPTPDQVVVTVEEHRIYLPLVLRDQSDGAMVHRSSGEMAYNPPVSYQATARTQVDRSQTQYALVRLVTMMGPVGFASFQVPPRRRRAPSQPAG
jgi:hypothetical protein